MSENLWGEIPVAEQISSPYSVLISQAKILGPATRGKLEGVVRKGVSGERFRNTFYIRAETLNDYHYLVLTAEHDVHLYPCAIVVANQIYNANDDAEFKAHLATILQSDRIRKVIQALLAQVRDDENEVPF